MVQMVAGETKIDEMVAKLDSFVNHIDKMLDEGVQNESLYLAAREEALTLRQSLPGLDKYLAALGSHGIFPLNGIGGSGGGHFNFKPIGGGGGGSIGGGAGGGIIGGGSGLGLLGTIGLAVGIPLGVSNDNPGPVASQSIMSN